LHGKPKRPIRTIKRRGTAKSFGHGMTHRLAIYDMDRTVTFSGTYTGFLVHVAKRMAPWRLALFPGVVLLMLAYVLKLISRQRLKEMNQALMIGHNVERARLSVRARWRRSRRTGRTAIGWFSLPPPTAFMSSRLPGGWASMR
jgi:hypothetical protein